MKAYTDIEQSKKLAEILPIESADMCYRAYMEEGEISDYQATLCPYRFASWLGVPCWSLATLIKMLPKGFLLMDAQHEADLYSVWVPGFNNPHIWKDNPLDAVFEMILKLNEQKLL